MFDCNLKFKGTIENWDEGLPLGNGEIGSLVYGKANLIFALDRCDLWDLTPAPETKESGFNYKNMVALVKENSESAWKEFLRLFDGCYNHATPTKINAGKLIFDFDCNNAEFFLDIYSGIAKITNENFTIETFVSASNRFGVLRCDKPIAYKIEFPDYYASLGYSELKKVSLTGVELCYHKMQDGRTFGIAIEEECEAECIIIKYYVFKGKTEKEAFDTVHSVFGERKRYAEYKRLQRSWWRKFWNKSQIKLPDKTLEKEYYLSYYLFGSGNVKGGYPMPLQGLWTRCDGNLPPWKGDYHHDLNTQFTYVSYLKANHLEQGKVFVDYLWKYREKFKAFARNFYGVNGLLVPAVSTIAGDPLGGWPMYSLSPTMSIWLAKSFDDYYQYTADQKFFVEKCYPFFFDVCTAITGLLIEKDGKLYLPVSSSPEYGDCSKNAFMEFSNNDVQLLRYLYGKMIEYSKIRGKSPAEYEKILSKLDEPYKDNDGVFKLNKTDYIEKSHRHHSNLLTIYPLRTTTCENGKNQQQIEQNLLKLEQLGFGYWVGYSFPWFTALSACGYFGNRALYALQTFCKGFVAQNGFHLNGDYKKYGIVSAHYRPFTLEANYLFCDAVQEMLLQDGEGFLNVFPCVPDDWKNQEISFKNLLCKNNVKVSAVYAHGKITKFEIVTDKEGIFDIKNNFGCEELRFSDGQMISSKKGEICSVNFKKGKTALS